MGKKIIGFMFLFLVLISLAVAVPPFESTADGGLQFAYPPYEIVKENTAFSLHIHVINDTAVQTNTTTSCNFHLYNSVGNHILQSPLGFDSNLVEFELDIAGGNFTLGQHAYVIWCNNTNKQIHLVSGLLEVTKDGNYLSVDNQLFFMFIILAFFITLVTTLYTLFKNLESISKFSTSLYDVLYSFAVYIAILSTYYFNIYYTKDGLITSVLDTFISVGAFTHIFFPLVGLVLSMIVGGLKQNS